MWVPWTLVLQRHHHIRETIVWTLCAGRTLLDWEECVHFLTNELLAMPMWETLEACLQLFHTVVLPLSCCTRLGKGAELRSSEASPCNLPAVMCLSVRPRQRRERAGSAALSHQPASAEATTSTCRSSGKQEPLRSTARWSQTEVATRSA
jgi:hypothetical protein